jgi:hypothetical protein
MNTTHTQEFRVTVSAEYVSIYRANSRSRSPLHFFSHREWAPNAKTPVEAVQAVLSGFFGAGAGHIRQIDDNLCVTDPGYDRIGLSLEKAAWKDRDGKPSDVSVIVPIFKVVVYTAKIHPTSRAAMYDYDKRA